MAKKDTKITKTKVEKNPQKAKRFSIYLYIELISSVLFALCSISLHGDISQVALPVSVIFTAVTVYFGYFKMLSKKDGKFYFTVLKLVQYIPFVFLVSFIVRRAGNFATAFWYDLISVLLWCVVFVASLLISNCLNDKHYQTSLTGWSNVPEKKEKAKGLKWVIFELIDWVDALVQAVFMVLLIQIFILQLYVIPSESMVPYYLVKDRVAVSKLNCGPKFPLTNIGLGDFTKYNRGDIVVLRNPHYSMDRKSEVKSVISQLVYMLSFTTVNLNVDENGEPKADPLVKRIVGVEGEQLVMQDGQLYSRTRADDEFKPVKQDNTYAAWNLNSVRPDIKAGIREFPVSVNEYKAMLQLEEDRRNLDLDAAKLQANLIVDKFNHLAYKDNFTGKFSEPEMYLIKYVATDTKQYYYETLHTELENIILKLMNEEGGAEWFAKFMTSWIPAINKDRDMYEEANYRLNAMAKITFGNLVCRYAELIRVNENPNTDSEILSYLRSLDTIIFYARELDFRNMPVFPANDAAGNPTYIPDGCFFMMGDNRFNSLDLRHKYEHSTEGLTKDDPMAMTYESLMAPQYINKKLILGKPMFRFYRSVRH